MNEKLILVDGHGIAYRAYFALTAGGQSANWVTPEGEPTAGTFGFSSILLRILEKYHPDYLAVAFDRGKTFRNEMFEGYKGTRAKMPDDLRQQIERMRELVDKFGIPRLEIDGFEADDILGSTAKQAAAKGYDVKIITGDRDLLQLVDDKIVVCLSGGKISESKDFTPEMVKDYLGIPPELVVDYKALVGDTSDNYPGVAGIGPKTALTLLEAYGSLDGIYANLSSIKGAAGKKLEANRENAYLSQALARIKTDLPEFFDMNEASTANMNFPAVEQFFKELSFKTLIPKLRKIAPEYIHQDTQPSLFSVSSETLSEATEERYRPNSVVIVNTPERLESLVNALRKAPLIAVDTETTGVEAMRCDLVGISLSVQANEGYYIPLGHGTLGSEQLSIKEVRAALDPILRDASIPKAGHNIKFDLIVLKRHGFSLEGITFDTMIAAWIVEPDSRNLGLKPMAQALLGVNMIHIEELIGKGKKQLTMDQVSVEEAAPYAAADAEITLRLVEPMRQKFKETESTSIFEDLEIPLIPVLADMEMAGIRLDQSALRSMSEVLTAQMAQAEAQIFEYVGHPFNINSTQQLSEALFNDLGLPAPTRKKKTAAGFYSTAAEVLEEMREIHPVIDCILNYREISKLKSTYADTLPNTVVPATGRVHTSFNQTGTVTGRLASNSPNLQNIPARSELGRAIRSAFTVPEGYSLLSVDYSQIELRLVAHMAQDEAMIEAFRSGKDIHAATAAAIYNIPIEDVTKEMRRHAKAINFGLIYGMSSFGLSKSANLTPAEAAVFVKTYFEQFPRVKTFLDDLKVQAAENGYVSTLAGRKRYFPNLKTEMNHNLRSRAEREAINAPVQGTSADILKAAMIRLSQELKAAGYSARILLQVHDELILEVRNEEAEPVTALVQHIMESVTQLSVPLVTEAALGNNWGELK